MISITFPRTIRLHQLANGGELVENLKNMLEINLQKIKFWVVVAIIQIASFGVGYYAASSVQKPQTTNLQIQPNSSTQKAAEPATTATAPVGTETVDCPIKGNISSKSKLYHVQGGAFYDRTDPEMCFNTEAEAQAAGFTKSSR